MTFPRSKTCSTGWSWAVTGGMATQLLQSAFALLADDPACPRPEDRRRGARGDARGVQDVRPVPRHAEGDDLRLGAHADGRPAVHAGPRRRRPSWPKQAGWSSPVPAQASCRRAWRAPGREKSIGVSIRLPFEQGANPVIAGDAKYVSMKYFFTRKLMLVKESKGFVCLPGGFGTLDETFELLTLTQTGKGLPVPIVFLDTPGDPYWESVHEFVGEQLVQRGLVSPADTELYLVTDDCQQAADETDQLLSQLRLDPLRRSAHRHANEAGPHRRPAGVAQRAIRSPVHQRTNRPRRPVRARAQARTTSSSWPGSPSRSPGTRTATCAT